MPRLTFVRSSARDSTSIASNPARLLNLYPEPVGEEGRTTALLRPVYGMTEIGQIDGVFIRDMIEDGGFLYAISPSGLFRATLTSVVRLGDTAAGQTANLSRNLGAVTGCIGGAYFHWDIPTSTLSSPATGPIDNGVAWVEYLAGRTIIGEIGSGTFAWSEIADATTFPGLNFAVAEAREDATIRGFVIGNNLYLFGEKTTEIWGPAGSGANAFGPLGVVIERGLKSFGLVCAADDAIFVVGSDDIAYLMAGNEAIPVSTPAVTSAIRDGEPQSCTFWDERGHKFCAITFSDRPAWVLDLATKVWFERAEGPLALPWRCRKAAKLGDWVVAGDDGGLYALRESQLDAGEPLYREATSLPLENDFQWFTVAELEIMTGAGFETGSIALSFGDGIVFGLPQQLPLGGVGVFDQRSIYKALGRHRLFVARLSMTGPLVPIYADCRVRLA